MKKKIDSILASVIIVNYNGRHHLEKCLPSVLKTKSIQFEIIVVDNGSTDGSVSWLQEKYPQLILLAQEKNLGKENCKVICTESCSCCY